VALAFHATRHPARLGYARTAVLSVAEETVLFMSRLFAAERRRRGTRGRRRALDCYRQAVLVLRWFFDGTRLAQLAIDNRIGRSTAYRYLHEGIDVLAAAAPGCVARCWPPAPPGTLIVQVDGTLIRTDRCSAPARPSASPRLASPPRHATPRTLLD
jgi:hypothetical protein